MSKEEGKPHHHRSSLKQRNKPFKGGHSSRSKSRGRTDGKRTSTPVAHDLNRRERRHRTAMIQQQRRAQLASQRRLYAGKEGMSRIIAVLPVTANASLGKATLPWTLGETYYSEVNRQNLLFLGCPRASSLTRAQWIDSVLRAAQVADCFLFLTSAADDDFDQWGLDAFAILRSYGLSSSVGLIQPVDRMVLIDSAGKRSLPNMHQVKQAWLTRLQGQVSTVGKVFIVGAPDEEASRERIELERTLSHQHLNGISWRDLRPYMLTDSIQTKEDHQSKGWVVKVTGFIRGGKAFSANHLVHIPALGDNFIVSRIEAANETMDADATVQERDEMEGEKLDGLNEADPFSAEALQQIADNMTMEMEDSVPLERTEEAAKDGSERRIRVPKGTSSYQAAWLEGGPEVEESVGKDSDGEEVYEEITLPEEDSAQKVAFDEEEHQAKLREHRQLQYSQRHFPDEIDLDPSISARTRLQRYRGVQSLRTSTWDPNEGLPVEYGRIFRFADLRHSRKVALEEGDSPFTPGQRVTLTIVGISSEQKDTLAGLNQRTLIFGLLRYEQKQTVLSFSFTLARTFQGEIGNKEPLLAVIGCRTFRINPILSEYSSTPLHKMLRTADHSSGTVVGTIYGPVTWTPAPVLLLQPGSLELVAIGTLIDSSDPQRIILKRVTLTGSPFRIHKRSAVVRFMFFTPADVNWFKPVELITRGGARGHIRESLGTHGYMKCLFDRTVFHHDTVAMHLYKRVFPKWTTRTCLISEAGEVVEKLG